MAFPTSPVNGQQVVVNNITYQWSSGYNAWVRLVTTANIISANSVTVTGNVTVGTGLFWSNGASVLSGGLNRASYGISTLFGTGY